MQFPGIYKVVNETNGKYYVGSSRIPANRWKQHRYYLNRNTHHNDYLQNSWNKHHPDEFKFVIVDTFPSTITDAELLAKEQKWLDIAEQDFRSGRCYNLTFVANNPNMLLSAYSKKKRSESLRKVVKTEEWKAKISKSHMGIRPSVATRKKMRLAKLGWKQTEKQKSKATESRKKDWMFLSPTKEVVHIHDLKGFCRKNGLHPGCMYWVASGKRPHHKGWMTYA